MIHVSGISKTFRIAKRQKGLSAAVKAMFVREYNYLNALENISFDIGEGEIVGYIGPNGAGKSTSIKIMSGILVPDKGECNILDYTPHKHRKEYVKNIGVVFGQRTQLWWDVPVIDSYELLRDIYKIEEKKYARNLELLSETLELRSLLSTPLRQLSLGQRMKCEIAGSLLHDPKILFLDEPTIGLDAVSKLAVRQFIKKLNAEKRTTVILTTHDMHDIEALTDRIILIGNGRILYDGSFEEIKKNYNTRRILEISFDYCDKKIEAEGAKLLSWRNTSAEYEIDLSLASVSSVMNRLSSLRINDIKAESESIEEIIAKMYKEYEI